MAESKVQKALAYATRSRTVLVIAHRLSTIKNADRILVLQDGRIVEDGPFPALMRKHGAFYTYYHMQFSRHKGIIRSVSPEAVRAAIA